MRPTTRSAVVMWLSALAFCSSLCRGSFIWNESTNGDLSNSQSSPTALSLSVGTSSIAGTVGTGDTQDWIALTIPTGFQLSSDVMAVYSSTDSQGFTGVQAGSAFVGNPETTASAYLGYAHFGTGATNGPLPRTDLTGADLLPIMGNTTDAPGSQGFAPPLAAGTYTFLIQQLGAPTTYQFDFGVTPVPEPGTVCMFSVTAMAFLRRRPRSNF